jgi:hypothetical protein
VSEPNSFADRLRVNAGVQYSGIFRDQFPDVFTYQHGQTVEAWLQTVFNGDHQGQLAHCVF